jgi:hypothetical protein
MNNTFTARNQQITIRSISYNVLRGDTICIFKCLVHFVVQQRVSTTILEEQTVDDISYFEMLVTTNQTVWLHYPMTTIRPFATVNTPNLT